LTIVEKSLFALPKVLQHYFSGRGGHIYILRCCSFFMM